MLRLHNFPFPANWPGKEIKRIFERMLSEGGEYFSVSEGKTGEYVNTETFLRELRDGDQD